MFSKLKNMSQNQNTVQPWTSKHKLRIGFRIFDRFFSTVRLYRCAVWYTPAYHCSINPHKSAVPLRLGSHQISYPWWKHLQFIFNESSVYLPWCFGVFFFNCSWCPKLPQYLLNFLQSASHCGCQFGPHKPVSFCPKAGFGENPSWNRTSFPRAVTTDRDVKCLCVTHLVCRGKNGEEHFKKRQRELLYFNFSHWAEEVLYFKKESPNFLTFK